MVERGGGSCFTHQSRARGRIVEVDGGKDLDRDVPVELFVAGAIDLAHPAGAELGQDSIVCEPSGSPSFHPWWTVRAQAILIP